MHTLVVTEKMNRIFLCYWMWPPSCTCPMFRLLCSVPLCPPPGTLRADTGPSPQMGNFCVCLWVKFQVQLWGIFLSSSRPHYLCPSRCMTLLLLSPFSKMGAFNCGNRICPYGPYKDNS